MSPEEIDEVRAVMLRYYVSGHADPKFPGIDDIGTYIKPALWLIQERYNLPVSGLSLIPLRDPSFVGIWFFNEDPDNRLSFYRNDCSYIGPYVILIDGKFMDELQSFPKDYFRKKLGPGHDLPPRDAVAMENAIGIYPRNIWFWVVLHELGHLARGHDERSLSNNETLLQVGPGVYLQYPTSEREADEFVAEVLEVFGGVAWAPTHQLAAGINAYFDRELQRLALKRYEQYDRYADYPIELAVKRGSKRVPMLWRAIMLYRHLVRRFEFEPSEYSERLVSRLRVVHE